MTDISIGGMTAPAGWTIEEICANNGTYSLSYSDGAAESKTLTVTIEENGAKLEVKSGVGTPTVVTHYPVVRDRPNDRR